ncbi:methyl-accepting chemotaxis protein [Erythrobacter longus]|nr:methyl-accepting chemotaxis protein [Erythrobacter longus]
MKIARMSKLGAMGLVALLFLSAIVGLVGLNTIRIGGELDRAKTQMHEFNADISPPPAYLVEAFALANVMGVHPESYDINDKRLADLEAQYREHAQYWAQSDLDDGLKADLAQAANTDAAEFWNVVNDTLKPAVLRGDAATTGKALENLLRIYRAHRSKIDSLIEKTADKQAQVEASNNSTVTITLGVLAVIILLLIGALIAALNVLSRKVLVPLADTATTMEKLAGGDTDYGQTTRHRDDEIGAMTRSIETFRTAIKSDKLRSKEQKEVVETLSEALNRLAAGDLSHRIDDTLKGEQAKLRDAYNISIQQLSRIIDDVRGSARSVNMGSDEIRAASDDLATRNEQQAASLEETAASMRQVTELVRKTATNAGSAQTAMKKTHEQVSDGGQVVTKAVDAMASIEKSSEEITQIIDVIEGIAFQTNLLALNAGVEAARAGDAGKGFAVVANEVRALAQRSAEAANDIKSLISTSTTQVSEGVTLVGETGSLLEGILEKISSMAGEIDNIASMAVTQATSIEQINSSVDAMDQMTQRNAAMVEESTAAARSLSDEAGRLQQMVSQFRTASAGEPRLSVQSSPQAPAFQAPAIKAPPKAAPLTKLPVPKPANPPSAPAPAFNGSLALDQQPNETLDDQDWSEF